MWRSHRRTYKYYKYILRSAYLGLWRTFRSCARCPTASLSSLFPQEARRTWSLDHQRHRSPAEPRNPKPQEQACANRIISLSAIPGYPYRGRCPGCEACVFGVRIRGVARLFEPTSQLPTSTQSLTLKSLHAPAQLSFRFLAHTIIRIPFF